MRSGPVYHVLTFLFSCLCTHSDSASFAIPSEYLKFESRYAENRTAKAKFNDIFRIMKIGGSELPPYDSFFDFLKHLNFIPFLPGLQLSLLTSTSMFRPWKLGHKILHTRPAHASVKFVFNREAHESYTGLFESDSVDFGIMSFSPGFKIPNITNFFAINLRHFRDNVESSSIIAAFNMLSQPNWNVFDYMICTHYNWLMALPLITLGPLKGGQGWTQYFNQFGLRNLAEYRLNGERVQKPIFPWALCLVPGQDLRQKSKKVAPTNVAVEMLKYVKAGDQLYEVWAIKEPIPLAEPSRLMEFSHHIGELIATSEFFTTQFGAQRLLGTHQPFEKDLELRPDWIPYARPYYLIRAGAVGVYSELFRQPEPDIEQGSLNLYILMSAYLRAFTTKAGFQKLIRELGIGPIDLYRSTVTYVLETVIPSKFNSETRDEFTPIPKRSSVWAMNTLQNLDLYISSLGIHPPLRPLKITQLGFRKAKNLTDVISLVNEIVEYPKSSMSTIEKTKSKNFEKKSVINQIWQSMVDVESKHIEEEEEEPSLLGKNFDIENTLFLNVKVLPFNVNLFNNVALNKTY